VAANDPLGVVALWSLVAALAFSGTALTWLVFADGIALGVFALADLAAHESTTERISGGRHHRVQFVVLYDQNYTQ
jgi:hypothetical protein